MGVYKEIYYEKNPWKYGNGEYQDLLGMDNEPELIVYTPDVERYCENEREARLTIEQWIDKNGDVDTFRELEMIRSGIPF